MLVGPVFAATETIDEANRASSKRVVMPPLTNKDGEVSLQCVNLHATDIEHGTSMRRLSVGRFVSNSDTHPGIMVRIFSCSVCGYVELYTYAPTSNA